MPWTRCGVRSTCNVTRSPASFLPSQLFIGIVIALVFFAITLVAMPHKKTKWSLFKCSTEMVLAITFLCALMDQIDLRGAHAPQARAPTRTHTRNNEPGDPAMVRGSR